MPASAPRSGRQFDCRDFGQHESALPINFPLDRKALIYVVEPAIRGQAVKVLISRVKKAGYYCYRSFNPDEDLRLSASDAIHQVAVSSGIVMPLQERADWRSRRSGRVGSRVGDPFPA